MDCLDGQYPGSDVKLVLQQVKRLFTILAPLFLVMAVILFGASVSTLIFVLFPGAL